PGPGRSGGRATLRPAARPWQSATRRPVAARSSARTRHSLETGPRRRRPTAPTVAGSSDAQIYRYSDRSRASLAGGATGRIRVESPLMSKRYFLLPIGIGAVAIAYWALSYDMAGATMLGVF